MNGVHHCTLRYKQLRHLHDQLKRLFNTDTLPEFPSKKLLPLSPFQTEERRLQLEKYIQSSKLLLSPAFETIIVEVLVLILSLGTLLSVSQDQRISSSTFFHSFLRLAQNETHLSNEDQRNVHIRITLPGEEVMVIPVLATEETSSVIKVPKENLNL